MASEPVLGPSSRGWPACGMRLAARVLLVLGGVWLALACLANAESRALTQDQPWVALAWDDRNPAALSRLADLYAETVATAADSTRVRTLASQSLLLAPLNGAALRMLGVEAQREGDMARAARLMAASDTVTQRDDKAQLWRLDQDIRLGAYSQAYAKADVVLRREPGMGSLVFPVLELALKDPDALPPLAQRLARRPDWREGFLAFAFGGGVDLNTSRRLFMAVSAGPAPPTEVEAGAMVKRLVADGAYAEAYDLWRRLAGSGGAGRPTGLYGGDFRPHPGPAPFNWRLADDGAAVAELGEAPDGGPALHVQFDAGANNMLAEQLVTLAPGPYRLSGAMRIEGDGGRHLLAWSVRCAGKPETVLGEVGVQPDAVADWRRFAVAFTVPAGGCGAQWIRLASFAQDRFTPVEGWARQLAIAPTAAPAQPPADISALRP